MLAMHFPAPSILRPIPAPVPRRDARRELLELITLRTLEDEGPLGGAELSNAVAALTCAFDLSNPIYALLHDLADRGLATTVPGRPPRYAITDAGRAAAETLAVRCWPAVRDALVELNVCLGCLSPRS